MLTIDVMPAEVKFYRNVHGEIACSDRLSLRMLFELQGAPESC